MLQILIDLHVLPVPLTWLRGAKQWLTASTLLHFIIYYIFFKFNGHFPTPKTSATDFQKDNHVKTESLLEVDTVAARSAACQAL